MLRKIPLLVETQRLLQKLLGAQMNEVVYWNQMYANALDAAAPSVVRKPRIFIDGNQWCALYGDNIQDGVVGFGDTPNEAMRDFDKNWMWQRLSGA